MPRVRTQLFAVATFFAVFPFFLRRRPRVERRITILAPPDQVFRLIDDLREWPAWSPWNSEEMESTYGDVTAGAGAVQRWRTGKMNGVLRILRSDTGRRVDYEVEMSGGKFQLLGRFDLIGDGACTRVIWRCVWEPALNPYKRYVDLFCKVMIGRAFSKGLASLKAAVESPRPAR